MRTGQRKCGLGVVKASRRPGGGVVALLTGLRESVLRVVGVSGALKILQVARNAS